MTDSSGSTATSEEIIWGAQNSNGGASLQQLPLTSGRRRALGDHYLLLASLRQRSGGLVNANWDLDWIIRPRPTLIARRARATTDLPRDRKSAHAARSWARAVDLVGTPFFLHYESSRVPGHAGADLFALKDALNLGGWTLSAHHVFEPLSLGYCAGGSCTPYSLVPKAMFFGNGNTRKDATCRPRIAEWELLVTSEMARKFTCSTARGCT